jgi:hypothetical protein
MFSFQGGCRPRAQLTAHPCVRWNWPGLPRHCGACAAAFFSPCKQHPGIQQTLTLPSSPASDAPKLVLSCPLSVIVPVEPVTPLASAQLARPWGVAIQPAATGTRQAEMRGCQLAFPDATGLAPPHLPLP